MNPDDWCPLHGLDGDVFDCRVERAEQDRDTDTMDGEWS